MLFKNWYVLGGKNCKQPHLQNRIFVPLRTNLFKISSDQPDRLFYIKVSPWTFSQTQNFVHFLLSLFIPQTSKNASLKSSPLHYWTLCEPFFNNLGRAAGTKCSCILANRMMHV